MRCWGSGVGAQYLGIQVYFSRFKDSGSGTRVCDSLFEIWDLRARVKGSEFRVQDSGCRVRDVWGSSFRVGVKGSGFRDDC